MRLTKEQAVYTADAAKKLHLVKKGYAWMFCPNVEAAAYHSVHWVSDDKQSVQCEGKDCPYCPRKVNAKAHVPCYLFKRWAKADSAENISHPPEYHFNADWRPMIIELTKNCFAALNQPSKPFQLGIAWRPGKQQNGKLYFKWLDSFLTKIPEGLELPNIHQVLPGVIGGTYRDYVELTLTDKPDGRIKHNSNSKSDYNDCDEGGDL